MMRETALAQFSVNALPISELTIAPRPQDLRVTTPIETIRRLGYDLKPTDFAEKYRPKWMPKWIHRRILRNVNLRVLLINFVESLNDAGIPLPVPGVEESPANYALRVLESVEDPLEDLTDKWLRKMVDGIKLPYKMHLIPGVKKMVVRVIDPFVPEYGIALLKRAVA